MGLLDGLLGGGGNTTTVQKSEPWAGVQPFLTGTSQRQLRPGVQPIYQQQPRWVDGGDNGPYWDYSGTGQMVNPESDYITSTTQGIFPEAARLYGQNAWTPGMQALTDDYAGLLGGRGHQAQQVMSTGQSILDGALDPRIFAVGNIAGAPRINAQQVDPTKAFRSLGAADPTSAVSQMLTGQVDTSALDPVVDNAFRRMGEGFNEQVLPGLRGQALAAGQYGGSRQGIAEGLAGKGLAYSMGDVAAGMYNNAFNTAQANRYGTANNMAGLGVNNAQANANRDLAAQQTNAANTLGMQQFNANLGLQNNQQSMQQAAQQLTNRMQGANIMGGAQGLQDQLYQQQVGLLGAPGQFDWRNLSNYASIVQPGAGMGGTSSTTAPDNRNPLSGALGGALGGAQIAGLLGTSTGWGAGLGGAIGLLSDRRFKTDIEPVGTLDNGLTVYRYRYKAGGPLMLGVMADEVKRMNPGAVLTVDGVDFVDYGGL